jgi:hypothetical protein
MGKVIKLPLNHFLRDKNLQLTPLMITTLKKAYSMQVQLIPFGQQDIDGSFNALLSRGLIKSREIYVDGIKVLNWFVTESAIKVLKDRDITNNK